MTKLFVIAFMTLVWGLSASGQKMEVMYFKADLACCRAKACDALENDLKSIMESNFKDYNIKFSSVKISDAANKALVEKYKAGSQTVVVVITHEQNETTSDITDIVKSYSRNRDRASFEKELLTRLSENAN